MKSLILLPIVFLVALVATRATAFTASSLYEASRLRAQWDRFVLNETGGVAMQLITGFVTQPNTGAAWTMATGDSLTIRNGVPGSAVNLLTAWADNQVAGFLQLKSPQLHDNVVGLKTEIAPSFVRPLLPLGFPQRLYPQDTLTATQAGSNTAGDIESGSLLVLYDDLPGAQARFIGVDELERRMVEIMTTINTLSLTTGGGYTGEEAINAETDQFKANQDYALLGYLVDVECCTIGWRGSDTSNLRIGGPGCEDAAQLTSEWFIHLARAFKRPLIPVFNAANKGSILIDGVQDENGGDVTVTSIFARLQPVGGIGR